MPEEKNIEVVVEGRANQITVKISPKEKVEWFNQNEQESPVVVTFVGDHGFFIRLFDHRRLSYEAFKKSRCLYGFIFNKTPCLVAFRKKGNCQYLVLADIGTPDIQETTDSLVLTKADSFDKQILRIVGNSSIQARHLATKICLCKPREGLARHRI